MADVKKKKVSSLKIIGIVCLVPIVLICLVVGYFYYQFSKPNENSISAPFETDNDWKWHNKSERVQIAFSDKIDRSILRKVTI